MTQTILSTNIAGVAHASPDFEQLNAEDAVDLILEPHNQFDPRAIRVQHRDAGKLGYVPKESTVCVHDALENGFVPTARIISFNDTGKYPKIHLVVTITL